MAVTLTRRTIGIAQTVLLVAALFFYVIQNQVLAQRGGSIAVGKALWLGCALYMWIVLPTLILSDHRVDIVSKRAYKILLAAMLLRAPIELVMMYLFHNWHPYYGISFNLVVASALSMALWATRATPSPRSTLAGALPHLLRKNGWVTAALFLPESLFAWYMIHFIWPTKPGIFFVWDSWEHWWILAITWFVVGGVTIWQGMFLRKLPSQM